LATIGGILAAHEKQIARANVSIEPATALGYRNALPATDRWAKGWQLACARPRRRGAAPLGDKQRIDAAPATILERS
jgi:hypothetical protein